MKRIIVALLVALGLSILASTVDAQTRSFITPRGDQMRLLDKQCEDPKILATILPEYRRDFRAAEAVVDGVSHSLCYDAVDLYDGNVYVVGPGKQEFLIPALLFTPEVES